MSDESGEGVSSQPGVTSRDVARLAGVSQATVSRILTGSANVTPQLRARVVAALEQTGYRPNAMAQAMRTGRTGTIGVVVAKITNPFYPELLETIGAELAAADHRMIVWETEFAGEASAVQAIQQRLVDGVVFTTAMPGSAAVAEASRRDAPMVLVNRTLPGVRADQVSSDNEAGAALAGHHVLSGGRTRVGFVAGTPRASTAEERLRGLRQTVEASDAADGLLVVPGDFSHDAGRRGLEVMMASRRPPTAIVAINDVTALGILDQGRALGLRVPEDMWVVGFDDIAMASWHTFDLTTVRQPSAAMARTAVRRLLARVGGERDEHVHQRFDCELIRRGTTR